MLSWIIAHAFRIEGILGAIAAFGAAALAIGTKHIREQGGRGVSRPWIIAAIALVLVNCVLFGVFIGHR